MLWAGGILVIVVIAAAMWGWWWWWPRREVDRLGVSGAKDRADVEDNFRKTVGQLLGGAAVLIGAAFAYFQTQWTLQASHDQLISQEKQTQRTLQASHEQLISQQVSKGFELLGQRGSDKIIMRLGGIYALEGVMKTSEQYHESVLEALCAFVRDGTKDSQGPSGTDIQATLTVIGRREAGAGVVDLSGARIPNVRLFGAILNEADLSHADLNNADLRRAMLRGANLDGADLSNADLSDANLSNVELFGANLRGTHLRGANLSGAIMVTADLSHADLSNAFVAQSQLDKACGDEATKLPFGVALKPCR
jgi:hypothetical protein